jgi:hypothetical protein
LGEMTVQLKHVASRVAGRRFWISTSSGKRTRRWGCQVGDRLVGGIRVEGDERFLVAERNVTNVVPDRDKLVLVWRRNILRVSASLVKSRQQRVTALIPNRKWKW